MQNFESALGVLTRPRRPSRKDDQYEDCSSHRRWQDNLCAFWAQPFFAIYEIADGKVINKEMRRNTFTGHFRGGGAHGDGRHDHSKGDEHAHQTVAEGLQDCQTVISHGMGRRAWEDLRSRGIEMIVTDETEVERALNLYLAGELKGRTEKLH